MGRMIKREDNSEVCEWGSGVNDQKPKIILSRTNFHKNYEMMAKGLIKQHDSNTNVTNYMVVLETLQID